MRIGSKVKVHTKALFRSCRSLVTYDLVVPSFYQALALPGLAQTVFNFPTRAGKNSLVTLRSRAACLTLGAHAQQGLQ